MPSAVAVAIHLASEVPPELASATVKSCEAALGADHCRLEGDAPTDDAFYATVIADATNTATAHIRLLRHGKGPLLAERDLAFADEDAPADRWASVGVVIAALVTANARPPEPEPPATPPRTSPPAPRPPPESPKQRPVHPARIDLLGRVSHATGATHPVELGGAVRGSLAVARTPVFFRVAVGYSARLAQHPWLSFPFAGLGGGLRWGAPEARWAAEFQLLGLAERWFIAASEPGRSESDAVWRFGAAAGVDAVWAASSPWQVVIGADAQFLTPRVTIDVGGHNADRVPSLGWAVVVGPRVVP